MIWQRSILKGNRVQMSLLGVQSSSDLPVIQKYVDSIGRNRYNISCKSVTIFYVVSHLQVVSFLWLRVQNVRTGWNRWQLSHYNSNAIKMKNV